MGDAGATTSPFVVLEFGDDVEMCLLPLTLLFRDGSNFKNELRCCGDDGGVPSSRTLQLPVEMDVASGAAAAPHPICFGCSHAGIPLIVHSMLLKLYK